MQSQDTLTQAASPLPVYLTSTAGDTATVNIQNPRTLSIVIPSYNGLAHLIPCLRSLVQTAHLAGQAGRLQIIIQDDCSTDFDVMECIGPPAEPERNAVNLGFAGNCNAGARRAGGDILLFLNQDTRAFNEWFEPLMIMFDDPKVGIVGPKLITPVMKPDGARDYSIQSCGGLYDGNKGPFHRFLGWAADDRRVNVRERVSWTTGAALAIRRDLFAGVGGFDEDYKRGYFEDVDLCEKVKGTGFEIWYCPDAIFQHTVGVSGGVPAEVFKTNSMRFHRKWDAIITPDTGIIHVNY